MLGYRNHVLYETFTDCVKDVLGRILYDCHAQTRCTLAVNDYHFGNPCPARTTKYLSLIFMCSKLFYFCLSSIPQNPFSQMS